MNLQKILNLALMKLNLQFFLSRHQDTHLQTVAGMRHLVVPRVVRLLEPPPVHACGTPHPATHLLVLQRLVETPLDMPHLATVVPRPVCVKTDGMRRQRQKEVCN